MGRKSPRRVEGGVRFNTGAAMLKGETPTAKVDAPRKVGVRKRKRRAHVREVGSYKSKAPELRQREVRTKNAKGIGKWA